MVRVVLIDKYLPEQKQVRQLYESHLQCYMSTTRVIIPAAK